MTALPTIALALTILALPAAGQNSGLKILAAPGFQAAGDGFSGVVPLRRDGKWGLLGSDGTWVAEPQFQDIGTPGRGRIPVEKADLWGVIDATGHQVTPFAFQAIGQIADWTPMRWKGQWWAVGPNGQPEGQPLPFDQLIGNDGTCMVGKAGGVPIAVNRGTPAASTMLNAADDMRAPSEGLVPISQDGVQGHLDCAYGTILGGQPAAVAVRGYHSGWAALQGPNGWGFASVFGNTAEFGGTWAAAGDFAEGLAAVQDSRGKWGYIRAGGQVAIPPGFDQVGPFADGMAPAQQAGQWGFIGKSGGWLVQPQFQAVKAASQGVAAVEQGGQWGVIAVSPLRIAGQALFGWALPGTATCPSHILRPGTAILSSPGGAVAQVTALDQALGVCLAASQDGFVQVQKDQQTLGWVTADQALPLR